jgi:hypothetical protein
MCKKLTHLGMTPNSQTQYLPLSYSLTTPDRPVHVPGDMVSNYGSQSSTKSPCRFDFWVERLNRIVIVL